VVNESDMQNGTILFGLYNNEKFLNLGLDQTISHNRNCETNFLKVSVNL